MAITVQIPTALRRHTAGVGSIACAAANLGELFSVLGEKFPELKPHLRAEAGKVRRFRILCCSSWLQLLPRSAIINLTNWLISHGSTLPSSQSASPHGFPRTAGGKPRRHPASRGAGVLQTRH